MYDFLDKEIYYFFEVRIYVLWRNRLLNMIYVIVVYVFVIRIVRIRLII